MTYLVRNYMLIPVLILFTSLIPPLSTPLEEKTSCESDYNYIYNLHSHRSYITDVFYFIIFADIISDYISSPDNLLWKSNYFWNDYALT